MKNLSLLCAAGASLITLGGAALADSAGPAQVSSEIVAAQRKTLAETAVPAGFGPQAPRDIDATAGQNPRVFAAAPAVSAMNLCNIHFHESAEHKGGEFTTYAGNGDGAGNGTGFKYNGTLTAAELAPYDHKVGTSAHGDLEPGDTIEVHYVYSTAKVAPGPTLGACLSDAIANPQLRVEAQVLVLVNDDSALDFNDLAQVDVENGFYQAPGLPTDAGTPVVYAGSTTGPDYDEKGSPFEVTWSVRPQVEKVSISSVDEWLQGNVFNEDHAHGVRNLVTNPDLLSQITPTN